MQILSLRQNSCKRDDYSPNLKNSNIPLMQLKDLKIFRTSIVKITLQ